MVIRSRVAEAAVWFICVCALAAPPVFADLMNKVEITDYLILGRTAGGDYGFLNMIDGSIGFIAEGNSNVKAEVELTTLVSETTSFDVSRAYVKARFPAVRITAGKTRVSWGQGFLFNAGDVIFGSMLLPASLVESVLRDETDFLCSLYFPIDRFAFVETIVLPEPRTGELEPGSGIYTPLPVDPTTMSYGGRIAGKIFDLSAEAGYLFKGEGEHHLPYASVHGNLILDWNLSVSCDITNGRPGFEDWKESIGVSFGLFHIINFDEGGALALRLESALYPFGAYGEELAVPSPEPGPNYFLYLYPEISWAPTDTMTLMARSIISPIDGSGLFFGGLSWNVYQGLTIGFMTSVMFGDEDDKFGWGRDGDLAFIASIRYVYGSEPPSDGE